MREYAYVVDVADDGRAALERPALVLAGTGIRSLEYDQRAKAFRLIAGAGLNRENRDFRLVEWNGKAGSPLPDTATFSRRLKP